MRRPGVLELPLPICGVTGTLLGCCWATRARHWRSLRRTTSSTAKLEFSHENSISNFIRCYCEEWYWFVVVSALCVISPRSCTGLMDDPLSTGGSLNRFLAVSCVVESHTDRGAFNTDSIHSLCCSTLPAAQWNHHSPGHVDDDDGGGGAAAPLFSLPHSNGIYNETSNNNKTAIFISWWTHKSQQHTFRPLI